MDRRPTTHKRSLKNNNNSNKQNPEQYQPLFKFSISFQTNTYNVLHTRPYSSLSLSWPFNKIDKY